MNLNSNKVIIDDLNYIKKNCSKELKELAGKRILFTGGAGFLGYYFLQALLESDKLYQNKKIKIDVYDNFIRGKKKWLSNLSKKNKGLKLVKKDITKPFLIKEKYDYIVHAASIASPTYYRIYPLETIDSNVNGIRNILNYSLKNKNLKGLLFFSSSEIYGDPDVKNIPTKEDYRGFVSCVGPRACYDESKRLSETLCTIFANKYNVPVKIVRPFNNYGPGLDINDKRIVPDLCKNILNNEDIILFSDGKAKRTYCYVADAICGYIKALVNGKPGESYNIGIDSPEISTLKLAQELKKISNNLFNYDSKIIFKKNSDRSYLTDNPQRRCPDLTKSRLNLGYKPKVSLNDGLLKTLLWYKGTAK